MTSNTTPKPVFLTYLNSFRGFAIINIVAIHAFYFSLKVFGGPIDFANELLFHNSTIYFALISGLLYTAILKKKGYTQFYSSKFKFVVLPYLFFTLFYSIFDDKAQDFFVLQSSFENYLSILPRNLFYGKALFVFWYITVLFFLYLVTPLLDYIMNIKRWGHWLIVIVIAMPLLVRREEVMELYNGDFLSFHNMIYFTGAYAAGMYIAANLEQSLAWIQKNKVFLIVLVVVTSIAIVFIKLNKMDRIGVFSVYSTLFYIQKIALSVLVLLFFKNLGDKQPKWLQPIAKDAFTIYFLHVFFLGIFIVYLGNLKYFIVIAEFSSLLIGAFYLVFSILLSMLTARLFRKVFGKYSRMIVGS